MRNIYIAVIATFIVCVLLFIASFLYLDKTNHKILYYVVNSNGYDIGTLRIDTYATEDKHIYKSAASFPFNWVWTESRTRIFLDKNLNLETFSREQSGNNAARGIYLENKKNRLSFLARSDSRFSVLTEILIKNETFIFDAESLVTYIPIIASYNFKRGRSQGFPSFILSQNSLLPPIKRFVTLTSIRDEYLEIDNRKVKTENLILKIRNFPQGSLWVSKSDRSIVRLEIPQRKLNIRRTYSPKTIEAKPYVTAGTECAARDVLFKNKNIQLAGTLTAPKNAETKYPGILLLWGSGPQNMDYQGMFSSLANYLSENGFCVLRFDKRGVGKSGGKSDITTLSEEVDDANSALEYLRNQKEVDPDKIAIIGHAKGAYLASKAASETGIAKAIILMAPSMPLWAGDMENSFELFKKAASKNGWGDEYAKNVIRSVVETKKKAQDIKYNWSFIMGKRVFLKNIREEIGANLAGTTSELKIPILILQGKEDKKILFESAPLIAKALEEHGNVRHTLIYYGYLGHFFGDNIQDGTHKMHYETDKEVLDNIKNWLNINLEKASEK